MASRYAGNIRSSLPDVALALSSYRFPQLHMDFPFAPFLNVCDFNVPQVYWEQATNPIKQLDKCIQQYRAFNNGVYKDLPIIPAGAAYPAGSWAPTVIEINAFNQTVKDYNLPGHCWWR